MREKPTKDRYCPVTKGECDKKCIAYLEYDEHWTCIGADTYMYVLPLPEYGKTGRIKSSCVLGFYEIVEGEMTLTKEDAIKLHKEKHECNRVSMYNTYRLKQGESK